jgi:hypothetical protein
LEGHRKNIFVFEKKSAVVKHPGQMARSAKKGRET